MRAVLFRRIAASGALSVAVMQRTGGDDRGQGLGEYALILGFIAVLCVAAVTFVGSAVVSNYQAISSTYP